MTHYFYPLAAILLWSGNVLVSKMAAGLIAPQAMTLCRLAVALMLMSTFLLHPLWRHRHTVYHYLPQLAVLGFLSMALYQCLSYQAAETTTASNMAVMTALNPLLTMVVSVWLLGEVLTWGMVAGGTMALFGILYLVGHGDPFSVFQAGVHAGDLLMLVASFCYAVYSVLIRKWALPISAWQSTFVQALFAFVFMGLFHLLVGKGPIPLNEDTLPLILYAGVLASVLLPFFWIQGVLLIGPSRCSMFMNLLPVLTALLAGLLLNEAMQSYFMTGAICAVGGVMIAQWIDRPLR